MGFLSFKNHQYYFDFLTELEIIVRHSNISHQVQKSYVVIQVLSKVLVFCLMKSTAR